jgi:hypothetical protein
MPSDDLAINDFAFSCVLFICALFFAPASQDKNPKGIPSFSPGLRGTSYPGIELVNASLP